MAAGVGMAWHGCAGYGDMVHSQDGRRMMLQLQAYPEPGMLDTKQS